MTRAYTEAGIAYIGHSFEDTGRDEWVRIHTDLESRIKDGQTVLVPRSWQGDVFDATREYAGERMTVTISNVSRYGGTLKGADVNWSAHGSQSPAHARAYAELLLFASRVAHDWEAGVFTA